MTSITYLLLLIIVAINLINLNNGKCVRGDSSSVKCDCNPDEYVLTSGYCSRTVIEHCGPYSNGKRRQNCEFDGIYSPRCFISCRPISGLTNSGSSDSLQRNLQVQTPPPTSGQTTAPPTTAYPTPTPTADPTPQPTLSDSLQRRLQGQSATTKGPTRPTIEPTPPPTSWPTPSPIARN